MTERWGPRDPVAAGWAATVVGGTGAALCVGYEVLGLALGRPSSSPLTLTVSVLFAAVVVAGVSGFRRAPDRMPLWTWVGLPLAAVAVVTVLDVLGPEPGAASQVALLYGVVFAAAHLRPFAVWTVSGVTLAASAMVAFTSLPARDAVADLLAMGGVVLMGTLLLVHLAGHRQALTARLAELASVDPLTGLSTRRELEASAQTALAAHPARRRDTRPPAGASLLVLDLDHFKELNDGHGHLVGDAALVHVARLLRSCVPRPSTVARIGGDELAVLLPDCTEAEAERAASMVLGMVLTHPLHVGSTEVPLSVSIGTAHAHPGSGCCLTDLYACADAALYRAKDAGRGCVVVG